MGNICGKTESDNFSSPGRALGTAPPQTQKSAPVPKSARGPGRTLGGSSSSRTDSQSQGPQDDARRRAAEAAEARATAKNKPGGKLQSQLTAQQKQTRSDTLKEASRQEVQSREAEDAANARNWD